MTAAVFVLIVVALGPLLFFAIAFPNSTSLHAASAAATAAVLLTLALAWAASPVAAELSAAGLVIRRRKFGPKTYPRENIADVSPSPRRFGMRVAGVGGFFGCFGLYYVSGLGFYWLQSARLQVAEGALLRRRTGRPIVVIVDDGAGFRAALETWMRPA